MDEGELQPELGGDDIDRSDDGDGDEVFGPPTHGRRAGSLVAGHENALRWRAVRRHDATSRARSAPPRGRRGKRERPASRGIAAHALWLPRQRPGDDWQDPV